MRRRPVLLPLACMVCLAAPAFASEAPADPYEAMLGYLAESLISDNALAGANGAIAVNQAAGDLNMQANVRAIASGGHADASAVARQLRRDEQFDTPVDARVAIAGQALADAMGVVSINQASGSGNAEVNLVTAVLASRGIRETGDEGLSFVSASAGEQYSSDPGEAGSGSRSVAVEATALRGFSGVLQLNQVAGSGNAASNQLTLDIRGP